MRIDLFAAIFVAIVAFASVPLASGMVFKILWFPSQYLTNIIILSELNAGLIGLSLTYSVSLSGIVQFCLRQSAEVENVVRDQYSVCMHSPNT